MVSKLAQAYIIGQENFQNWSQGFDPESYLPVLPHPGEKVPFKDPYQDWQEDRPGNYFSSWGPEEELAITLRYEDLEQIEIEGFGVLKAGDGIIPWLDKATPYEELRGFNDKVPGPMLIVEPGDKLKLELENNLTDPAQVTNFHTHGLHVSPVGHGDNVLFALESGETWDVDIQIPDDHFIGLDWYHPHLHGETNTQVGSGLGGLLLINPPHDLPDLDKWDPTERPMYFLGIQSFGIQQENRLGQEGDPLNQDPSQAIPAGTPLQVLGETEDGEKIYEMSDAPYIGFNAKPSSFLYDPAQPTGDGQGLVAYGEGLQEQPVENVIHAVNGQYNPTLELETGEWNLLSFANMSTNSFHIVQVVKEEGDELIPQEVTLVAIDGDASGIVEDTRRQVTELPILNPGSRLSIQNWFEEPGTYYVLSNGTEEILGDDTPSLIRGQKGFNDGHGIWGPQVLATIEVTGEEILTGSFPEIYETLEEQSQNIGELVEAAENGDFDRQRKFIWSQNFGGAQGFFQEPIQPPDDTEVTTWEGVYRINGRFFATEAGGGMPPLTMPMLGTTEVWNLTNTSGISDPTFPVPNSAPEWHPFHIHQNDFIVLEINGFPVKDIQQNYLDGVLSDTVALPPSHVPGSATLENPFGTPTVEGNSGEVKILMEFEDFPGSYVNHCHILFHEDAGMMAVVRVILNTEDTWLGLGNSEGDSDGTAIELIKGNALKESISLKPYGSEFTGGVDIAIADVNFQQEFDNKNVTDNVTDVVTIQTFLDDSEDEFTVKVFDGKTLFEQQKQGTIEFDGEDEELLIEEFTPFQNISIDGSGQEVSVASGDINGDGFADVVVGIGGDSPLIEIYSGKDFQLLTHISPFNSVEGFDSSINLAVGDADGDNFDDVYVTGQGLLQIYSGIEIDRLLRENQDHLDSTEVARQAALLSDPARPYGNNYTGEIEVTSGYILQRPEPDDPEFNVPVIQQDADPVQTNNANITTMAMDDLPEGEEQIKVWTFLGGGHHALHTGEDNHALHTGEDNHASHSEEDNHASHSEEDNHASHSGEDKIEIDESEILLRLDAAFTPDQEIEELAGTFADIPNQERGEPVLFTRTKDGNFEIIHLKENNMTESIKITSTPTPVNMNESIEITSTFTPADELEIISQMGRYDIALDTQDIDTALDAYTDDATLSNLDGTVTGEEAIRQVHEFLLAPFDPVENPNRREPGRRHVTVNIVIEPTSDTTADARSYLMVFSAEEDLELVALAEQIDKWFKVDGEWKIQSRQILDDAGFRESNLRGAAGYVENITTNKDDLIIGTQGDDAFDGGEGDDRLFGLAGNDDLFGNNGNDILQGDGGDDNLVGGDGRDILNGGQGIDSLTGGGDTITGLDDADIFIVKAYNNPDTDNYDVIQDFELERDVLGLVNGIEFSELSINQNGTNTEISFANSGELLSVLEGVEVSGITQDHFIDFLVA